MYIYNLDRFLEAQKNIYQNALDEIKSGRKQSHWMWFIFPQITGLGFSEVSQYYAIAGLDEAACYLNHQILGDRLVEVSNVLLHLPTNNANKIFGMPDDMKLRSSMTLFNEVSNAPTVFQSVLDKFFDGTPDIKTLEILGFAEDMDE